VSSKSRSGDAFQAGERIAELSVITLVGLGVAQIIVGTLTKSVGVTADGVDSILDSFISLIVWLGLHYSRRRPDSRFHFGYHKVESLTALVASFVMIAIAGFIMLQSYLTFLRPRQILYPHIALLTVLIAGTISMYRAIQMRKVATKYGLLSLRTDANNSIRDATSSFVVFGGVLGATLGVLELDAVGGMIISLYIIGVAYAAIRESSLILLDACESPEMTSVLDSALKSIEGIHSVNSIRLRPSGQYLTGIISVSVDGSHTVAETEKLRKRVLDIVSAIVDPIGEIIVVFRSETQS
jgi:cation diffusion facilitator family transporter